MQASSKTTLLVPTFNRPFHLRRLLKYYETSGFQGQIRILDSSEQNKGTADEFSALHLTWQHFDSEIGMLDKAQHGLSLVDTSYVQWCADDDFIDPIGITECERFLESAPDYVAAQGKCVHFRVTGRSSAHVTPERIRDEPMFDVAADSSVARLFQHVVNYRPTHYALQRTEQLTQDLNRVAQISGPSLTLLEPMHSFNCVVAGKVKRLPVSFEYREQHVQRLSGRIPGWVDLITSEDWLGQFRILKDFVADLLTRHGISEDRSRDLSLFACQEWLKLYFDKYYVRKQEVAQILHQLHTASPGQCQDSLAIRWRRRLGQVRKLIQRERCECFPPNLLEAIQVNAEVMYK